MNTYAASKSHIKKIASKLTVHTKNICLTYVVAPKSKNARLIARIADYTINRCSLNANKFKIYVNFYRIPNKTN